MSDSDMPRGPVGQHPFLGMSVMDRREAIRRVSVILGGVALVGGSAMLEGCRPGPADAPFTDDDVAFLDEVADTILPATSTPGAKAAQTGAFMALMVRDTYDPANRRIFRQGMRQIDALSRRRYDVSFLAATPEQRLAILEELDREQHAHSEARHAAQRAATDGPRSVELQAAATDADGRPITAETPPHFFRLMKELALLGYFTSEIGYTQAQRYVETPGRFDPCLPYTPGERAWAPHA